MPVSEAPAPEASIPDHVPAAVCASYDYFDQPGFREDPHAAIAAVFDGRAPRIVYTPLNGGHWVVGGYEELFDAARMPEIFSSRSMQIPEMADEPKLVPLNMDPPEHALFRAPLTKAFAPARMVRLEGRIRDLTRELLAKLAGESGTEFVASLAEPLPVFVFMEVAGIPRAHFREFRDNVFRFLASSDAEAREHAMAFFDRELGALVAQKRIEPRDDLLSDLVTTQIDGRAITHEELMGFCLLLMLAGLDTVTNAMALGMHHLARDPLLQARLREDSKLIPRCVEELLRRYAFASMGRIVMQDTEFHGLTMKAGDRVLLVPAGAGIDPAVYENPASVEPDRQQKGIPTFGFGPHRCAGMHLARLELRVMFEEWLAAVPAFALSPSDPPRFHGGVVIGLERLPLRW